MKETSWLDSKHGYYDSPHCQLLSLPFRRKAEAKCMDFDQFT